MDTQMLKMLRRNVIIFFFSLGFKFPDMMDIVNLFKITIYLFSNLLSIHLEYITIIVR